MATTQTVATLITKIRQRADQINSTTFDDVTELTPWVRSSLRQLYDIFCQQDCDWYTRSVPLSLTAGVESYTLPGDFKRISNVYALYNGGVNRVKISEFAYDDFGALNLPVFTNAPMRFRVMRNLLYIQPTPQVSAYNALEISYIPEHRSPLLLYTPIDDVMPAGADEWIVLDVLQKMAVKTRLQNMDDIIKSKQMLEGRLLNSIKQRSDQAPRMRDGYPPSYRPYGQGTPSGPLVWVAA